MPDIGRRVLTLQVPGNPHQSVRQRPPQSSGLEKQNTTKSLSSPRREYVSGGADRATAALNVTSLVLRPRTFSAVMRPLVRLCGGSSPYSHYSTAAVPRQGPLRRPAIRPCWRTCRHSRRAASAVRATCLGASAWEGASIGHKNDWRQGGHGDKRLPRRPGAPWSVFVDGADRNETSRTHLRRRPAQIWAGLVGPNSRLA
jgi:hypothetical protein